MDINDDLVKFQHTYECPLGCNVYSSIYSKSCFIVHLQFEVRHKCFDKWLGAWAHLITLCWKDTVDSLMEFPVEDFCDGECSICILGDFGVAMAPLLESNSQKVAHHKF